MAKETKVFMDPVHGLIMFDKVREKVLLDLIETPEFQRLRRIRQLGVAWVAFHGAVHTRFSHSLGVCHLAGIYLDKLYELYEKELFKNSDDFQETRLLIRCAALLHDIGHGPFSHTFEGALKSIKDDYNLDHESWTIRIIANKKTAVNEVLSHHKINTSDLEKIINKTYANRIAVNIVSGQSDADRMDYLQRDSLFTGAKYGMVDQDWMVHSLRQARLEGDNVIAIDLSKGMNSAVNFILARRNLFEQVYFHHKIRSAESQLMKILIRVADLILEDVEITHYDKLINIIKNPVDSLNIEDYIGLNDFRLLSEFENMSFNCQDSILKELCDNFINNRIFKSVDIESPLKLYSLESRLKAIFKPDGLTIEDSKYFHNIDHAVKTYYENDYTNPKSSEETDNNREARNEIWVVNAKRDLKELSSVSDVIRNLTTPFGKIRICFDHLHYDRADIRKIV